MIFGLPVNASIFRFNAIWPVLMPTQGQAPKMPLERKFTALLNVLVESFFLFEHTGQLCPFEFCVYGIGIIISITMYA